MPLSLVRISSCPFLGVDPTHLVPRVHFYLSLLLLIGNEFHGFSRLLTCSKYRLSDGGGRALCQVAISLRILVKAYMPGEQFGGCMYAKGHMHNAHSHSSAGMPQG